MTNKKRQEQPPSTVSDNPHICKKIIHSLRSSLGFRNQTLKESVEEAIEEHEATDGNSINGDEKNMLRNVLTFSELNVDNVMIPRADIDSIDTNVSYSDLKKIILDKAHTRFPIYRENLDDIIGFVHIKDLLSIAYQGNPENNFDIAKITRNCLFVPPSMKISTLLVKMQLSRVHMAIAVDEYGGTDGLITLEDLMEEIVGEIEDEHDKNDEILLTKLGENSFEASARIKILELSKELGTEISTKDKNEDFSSLGGLIFHLLGRIPAVGEVSSINSADGKYNIEFEISEADMRKIKKVIIRLKETTDA